MRKLLSKNWIKNFQFIRKIILLLLILTASPVIAQPLPLDSIKRMNPEEGLFYALEYCNVYEAHIVYAQAVLETGWFKSELAKKGNLFGIFDSRKKQYKTYNHWIESVLDYKEGVQSKWKGGDYYYFLEHLPYAADPEYVKKVRKIAERFIQYD